MLYDIEQILITNERIHFIGEYIVNQSQLSQKILRLRSLMFPESKKLNDSSRIV